MGSCGLQHRFVADLSDLPAGQPAVLEEGIDEGRVPDPTEGLPQFNLGTNEKPPHVRPLLLVGQEEPHKVTGSAAVGFWRGPRLPILRLRRAA